VIILLGVEMSYVWQNLYGVLRASADQVKDQPEFDLYFALRGLLEIARRFDRREEAPSTYRLAEQFGTTDSQMLRVMRKLEDSKLVSPIGADWTGYVPACDPDRISIEEVITQMEGVLRLLPDIGVDDREKTAIGEIFTNLNNCTAASLDHLSVGRLVRQLYSPREVRAEDLA
jgi:DNA-binding IscR family transcriptional regulator